MSRPSTTLRELLQQAAAKHGSETEPASTHALTRRAHEAGHRIVHTTIAAIMAGTYAVKGRPKRKTLEAIAYLAGVPYEVAHEAAGLGAPGRPFRDQLPDDIDDLTLAQRDVVVRVARALLDAQKASVGSASAGRTNLNPDRVSNRGEQVAYVTDEDVSWPDELPQAGEYR